MKIKVEAKYIHSGITALIVIIISLISKHMIENWATVQNWISSFNANIAPIILGLIIAYILNPILSMFERKVFTPVGKKIFKDKEKKIKKFSRTFGIICTQLIFLSFIFGFLWLVIPQIYESIRNIVVEMPKYIPQITKWAENVEIGNVYLDKALLEILKRSYEFLDTFLSDKVLPNMDQIVINISNGVLSTIFFAINCLVGFIVSIYVMAGKDLFRAQSKKIVYAFFSVKNANHVLDGAKYAHNVIGGYINGKIIESIMVGVICFIGMKIFNLEYPVLISVVIGVTDFIPFFGPFIGAVPSAILLFMISPVDCLIFVIFIVILQQIDGNIIGPIILGDNTGISGFWVLVSIIIGGSLFGFTGMVLSVPVFACIYELIKIIFNIMLKNKNLPIETDVYRDISHIDSQSGNMVTIEPEIPQKRFRRFKKSK